MSNASNDVLYDRAQDLIGYINVDEASKLNACMRDLEAFYALIHELELKYKGAIEKDALVAYRASKTDMWPEEDKK